jgi:hypothetical protein
MVLNDANANSILNDRLILVLHLLIVSVHVVRAGSDWLHVEVNLAT